jgi:CPA2 family monovalent cation:H+ antiporter-2
MDIVRRIAPSVPVLARARYLREMPELTQLGMDEVVAEEVEGGIEMISKLLRRLEMPRNDIEARLKEARAATAGSQRKTTVPRGSLAQHAPLAGMKIESLAIPSGGASVGHSIADLRLRTATGATVLALKRGQQPPIFNPDPNWPLASGDVLYLSGSGEAVRRACELLSAEAGEAMAQ